MDHSNGGIRRHDSNSLTLLLASIPVGTSRTVKFHLINSNPIDMPLESFELTIRRAEIQLESIEPLNATHSISQAHLHYRNENISQLVIPAQHQATFSLRIWGRGPPRFVNESLLFQTSYQVRHFFLSLVHRSFSSSDSSCFSSIPHRQWFVGIAEQNADPHRCVAGKTIHQSAV